MHELFAIMMGFPTGIFTVLMVVVVLYWLLVILGAMDLEILDVGEAVEAFDSAIDGVVDGLDGAAEGGADGLADGAEVDLDGDGVGGRGFFGWLNAAGLSGVPMTISLSLVIFLAWAGSLGGLLAVRRLAPTLGASVLVASLVAIAAFVVGVWGAAVAIRPLRPAFRTHQAPRRHQFVGRVCTIVSQRVDERFGQAEIADGGAGLLVDVRCFDENDLTRGDRALVFDYDPRDEVFHVARARELEHA